MHTREALKILSKGEKTYTGSPVGPLAERAAEFSAQYDARENEILAAKNRDTINKPILQALHDKVAKMAGAPDNSMPVAMTFYVLQGMKRVADANPGDRGIAQCVAHLQRVWQKNPMGSLSLGEAMSIRQHMTNTFPKSKVAKTLDTEISRVGFSKLPVAKIARVASAIKSQSEFDAAITANGWAGTTPKDIQARTLVRELVNRRGVELTAETTDSSDKSNQERISARLAHEMNGQLMPLDDDNIGPPTDDLPLADDKPGDPLAPVAPPMPEDEAGLGEVLPMMEEVEEFIEDTAPPEADQYIQKELAEGHSAIPGSAEWGFEEAEEGHTAPPPTEQWMQEELEEHGLAGGPPADPLDVGVPPVDEHAPVPDLEAAMEEQAAMRQADYRVPMDKAASAPPGWKHTVEKMKKHKDIDNPFALAWYMKDKGYKPHDKKASKPASHGEPKAPKPASDGHVEVETYAPEPGKGDKALKAKLNLTAAEIEAKIIDAGETVKVGAIAINVNDNDEVELWVRGAGQACSLMDLDTAIADFMKYASDELNPNVNSIGGHAFIEVVPVPCAKCATVTFFQPAADSDVFACECGYRTKAATINGLLKHGQLEKEYRLEVQLPAQYASDPKTASENIQRVIRMVEGMQPRARVESQDKAGATFALPSTDENELRNITRKLQAMGITQFDARRWAELHSAQFDPGHVSAPGSADMPMAQDVTPQGVSAPQPAADKPGGELPIDPAAGTGGQLSAEDIKAAMMHYRSMGLGFLEAIKEFGKDYSERIENHWSPQEDALVIGMAQTLYTGAPAPMAAKAFKEPKVNEQQEDWVKPSKSHADSSQEESAKLKPAVVKSHPAKQKSPTDLGSDDSAKDPGSFKAPKPKPDGHVPGAGSAAGTSAVKSKSFGKSTETDAKMPMPSKIQNGGLKPAKGQEKLDRGESNGSKSKAE